MIGAPLQIDDLTLSPEQAAAARAIEESSDSFFITGRAGTGKSSLLQYIRHTTNKRFVVVAPTGVAALTVGGQTIHSLFRLPFNALTPDVLPTLRLTKKTKDILAAIDMLIIDEISMVRVDILEAIDYLLKKARKNPLPFGGLQVVMFGDMHQLPPVVTSSELEEYFADTYGGHFSFHADAWKELNPTVIILTTHFRQADARFISALNAVRTNRSLDEALQTLNSRVGEPPEHHSVITLTARNKTAEYINKSKLAALPGKEYSFKATIKGDKKMSAFPTDAVLKLKVGAQVMLIKNDPAGRWVNGTLAEIIDLNRDQVIVAIDGDEYEVEPVSWDSIRYHYDTTSGTVSQEIVSRFRQLPIKLAWAITIHKSQGQTFDSVVIDLDEGAFAHGQTYVALSRCRSLDTLYLTKEITQSDIMVDNAITVFA
ncbi:MAG: AAA family ATPase [Pseudomonadales bacterium]|nr:AAA family ATPase [Pseudomonadales bacterium]